MIATLTMCSLDFDEKYIPHFLDHYNKQGVDRHFLILHSKEEVDEEWFQSKYCSDKVNVFFAYGEWNCEYLQGIKHNVLQKMNVTEDDWIINADIDEHVESIEGTLRDKILKMKQNGENACVGHMIDRIASDGGLPKILPELNIDGTLPEITPELTLKKQFPIVSNFSKRTLKSYNKKISITRGDLRVKGGGHVLVKNNPKQTKRNREILMIHHYKWSENTISKLEERVKTHYRFQHRRESEKFLKLWNQKPCLLLEQELKPKNKDFCFLAIPKCASTSFRPFCDTNHLYFIKHHRQLPIIAACAQDKKAICIFRDPVERVLSAYYYLKSRPKHSRDYRDWILCNQYKNIENFIQNGLEQASKSQLHFLPQSFWWKLPKEIWLLSLENLQADTDNLCEQLKLQQLQLCHANKSAQPDTQLSQESINKIKEIYKEDVDVYLSNINAQKRTGFSSFASLNNSQG